MVLLAVEATREIQNEADVCELVDSFYQKVRADEVLGVIFDDAVGVNWDVHLPLMHQFWQTILLHKPGYRGNPIGVHVQLNQQLAQSHGVELEAGDFERWLSLFNEAVDERFTGRRAEMAKRGAQRMAGHMKSALAM